MSAQLPVVNTEQLIKLCDSISQGAYALIDMLPASEEWDIALKLRHEAVDMVNNVYEGCGTLDPRDATWRLSQARGHLSALKGLIRLAHKNGDIELDPELLLAVEKAVELIDTEIPGLPEKTKEWIALNYPTGQAEAKNE